MRSTYGRFWQASEIQLTINHFFNPTIIVNNPLASLQWEVNEIHKQEFYKLLQIWNDILCKYFHSAFSHQARAMVYSIKCTCCVKWWLMDQMWCLNLKYPSRIFKPILGGSCKHNSRHICHGSVGLYFSANPEDDSLNSFKIIRFW